mmetsp:Transcript_105277/g.297969  ORF Transcript_105277/g.297969 Transcript_105277/m.297969 type:complete len:143 (-) Transcript_105277:79-507(-)
MAYNAPFALSHGAGKPPPHAKTLAPGESARWRSLSDPNLASHLPRAGGPDGPKRYHRKAPLHLGLKEDPTWKTRNEELWSSCPSTLSAVAAKQGRGSALRSTLQLPVHQVSPPEVYVSFAKTLLHRERRYGEWHSQVYCVSP